MPDQRHPVWTASDPSKLLWRVWDDDCVVFDCRSGEIHLLNPVAAEALKLLEERPADANDLTRELGAALGQAPAPEFRGHIEDLLGRFDELGLIEPVEE